MALCADYLAIESQPRRRLEWPATGDACRAIDMSSWRNGMTRMIAESLTGVMLGLCAVGVSRRTTPMAAMRRRTTRVLQPDRVGRLDLRIDASDWQAVIADMQAWRDSLAVSSAEAIHQAVERVAPAALAVASRPRRQTRLPHVVAGSKAIPAVSVHPQSPALYADAKRRAARVHSPRWRAGRRKDTRRRWQRWRRRSRRRRAAASEPDLRASRCDVRRRNISARRVSSEGQFQSRQHVEQRE